MRRLPPDTRFVVALGLPAALGLTLGLAGCSNDAAQRTESHYCTEVGNHLVDLASPTIATQADINRVLKAWRAVSASVPLAVEKEWNTLVVSMETAATVKPDDPVSLQRMADTARAAEKDADKVIAYTAQRCGATIGKPATAP